MNSLSLLAIIWTSFCVGYLAGHMFARPSTADCVTVLRRMGFHIYPPSPPLPADETSTVRIVRREES